MSMQSFGRAGLALPLARVLRLALWASVIALGAGLAALIAAPADAQSGRPALIDISEPIQPATASYLARVIEEADAAGAPLVVVTLDTPGGLLDDMRDMVNEILNAPMPIIVYVSPSGARAASAGTFILAAAHVAAMAPGTSVGAASPVDAGGRDIDETMRAKVVNDVGALIRAIADARGRNAEALNATVFTAQAYSANEALELDIIDLIARDLDELLAEVNGMTFQVRGGEARVEGVAADFQEASRTPLESFLSFVARPDIAFLLLTIGGICLVIELLSPGLWGPGVIAAILIALSLLGFGSLPVNWVGVGLIVLAFLLLYLELQVSGWGILGAGAAVSLIIGGLLLFGGFSPGPIEGLSFRVNYWLIGGLVAVSGAFMMFVTRDMLRAAKIAERTQRGISTSASLIGQTAIVTTDLAPQGMVVVNGEEWSAVSETGETIQEGDEVIIADREALTLSVMREATISGR